MAEQASGADNLPGPNLPPSDNSPIAPTAQNLPLQSFIWVQESQIKDFKTEDVEWLETLLDEEPFKSMFDHEKLLFEHRGLNSKIFITYRSAK